MAKIGMAEVSTTSWSVFAQIFLCKFKGIPNEILKPGNGCHRYEFV